MPGFGLSDRVYVAPANTLWNAPESPPRRRSSGRSGRGRPRWPTGSSRPASRAAVVIRHGLDQLQLRRVVRVHDRAGDLSTQRHHDIGSGGDRAGVTGPDPRSSYSRLRGSGPPTGCRSPRRRRSGTHPSRPGRRSSGRGVQGGSRRGQGPVVATAVPPSLFVTVLTSFSSGVSSVFTIVQVT